MAAKRRNRKKILSFIVILGVIILAGYMILAVYLNNGSKALDPGNKDYVSVVIPAGTGTAGIGNILQDNNLIDSVEIFRIQSRLKGFDGKFKAGEYRLSQNMSMTDMMRIIVSGNAATMRFTIPEGYDIKKTIGKLSSEKLINAEVFAQEIETGQFNFKFLKDAPSGPNRLEGYLFPETYEVFTFSNEHDIINRMLEQFDRVFTKEYYERAEELNMDINEVLTIASLIERETQVNDERAIVSSVIRNRLAAGMPLQIDATVQYALGEQKDRLSYEDLKINSPYNTYKINGLPPGPICSPGAESIHAALYPADTKYLYYVLKPELNGTHNFAVTYDEFIKYKNQYLKAL